MTETTFPASDIERAAADRGETASGAKPPRASRRKPRKPRRPRLPRLPKVEENEFDITKAEQMRSALLMQLIWGYGAQLVEADDGDPVRARAFIGGLVKQIGREALARGVLAAILECTGRPMAFLSAWKRSDGQNEGLAEADALLRRVRYGGR